MWRCEGGNPVHTDFHDFFGDASTVDLPDIMPGTNFERSPGGISLRCRKERF